MSQRSWEGAVLLNSSSVDKSAKGWIAQRCSVPGIARGRDKVPPCGRLQRSLVSPIPVLPEEKPWNLQPAPSSIQ